METIKKFSQTNLGTVLLTIIPSAAWYWSIFNINTMNLTTIEINMIGIGLFALSFVFFYLRLRLLKVKNENEAVMARLWITQQIQLVRMKEVYRLNAMQTKDEEMDAEIVEVRDTLRKYREKHNLSLDFVEDELRNQYGTFYKP